ncbi:hypothetical protein DFH07DRAFT_959645 [Mycena maculata]|uniref:DRBM domain-containing protein n=1 Tax=Mycena maculata TaxID=230809 RepID=A0AAD7NDC8_9AGAR|nr:hypothetical protein DFH07DRAFT_959645 [Mycena maculata]
MANYITQLNNYFQAQKASHTLSWVEYSTGPSHEIKWTVQCKISGEVKGAVPIASIILGNILKHLLKGTGVADSKAAAKEEAARQALVALGF